MLDKYFENGVIVKIYKSQVDPILAGGACAAPKLRRAFPQDLWLNLLPHSVQLGNFSSAWNLAILQVGPRSGMIMQQEQISSGNLPDKQWHLHQISSGNLPDKQWHLQPPP